MNWENEYLELLFPKEFSKRNEIKADILKFKNIPNSLFKFHGVKEDVFLRKIEDIKNDRMWLSRPDKFNDPYDCFFVADFQKTMFEFILKTNSEIRTTLGDEIESVRKEGSSADKLFERFFEKVGISSTDRMGIVKSEFDKFTFDSNRKYLCDTAKISCFSVRNDSIPMWAHYADEHHGFCVEYDLSNRPREQAKYFCPVIYTEKLADVTDEFINGIVGWGVKPAIFKSKDWSYEKEWRFICITPPTDLPGVHINFFPIKGIYLGTHIQEDHERELKKIALEKKIPVYKMKMSVTDFAFESFPVVEIQ